MLSVPLTLRNKKMKLTFEKTCDACPEQYDAFYEGELIAYLRLRHGHFTVLYPDVGGECIYEASPEGDGEFEDEKERSFYLMEAKIAILSKLLQDTIAAKCEENDV